MHFPADKHGERLQAAAGDIIKTIHAYFPFGRKVEIAIEVETGIADGLKS